jgi:hypothetical protein
VLSRFGFRTIVLLLHAARRLWSWLISDVGRRMKRLGKVAVVVVCIAVGYFSIGALLFRLPVGQRSRFEGEVMWKLFTDSGESLARHWLWEVWPWGGTNLFLVDGRVFQISARDDKRVWSEPWSVLDKQRRTKRVILSAYPVIAGGYGCARVEEITDVPGVPYVTK